MSSSHGPGAINIDGCRVEHVTVGNGNLADNPHLRGSINGGNGGNIISPEEERRVVVPNQLGRFPANLLHDGSEEVIAAFPEAKGQQGPIKYGDESKTSGIYGSMSRGSEPSRDRSYKDSGSTNFAMKPGARRLDQGSAARFFYAAKASGKDRNEGVPEGMKNTHVTVKPNSLARYLCRLITPPGGTTLDPFGGSGSISKAALEEGFNAIYIDNDPESYGIAKHRISSVEGSQCE